MTAEYDLFIANEAVGGSGQERFASINPYTGEAWAHVPQASAAQVADAIAAARHAFNTTWRKTTGKTRGQLLNKLADLLEANAQRLGTVESTDNGKIIRETSSQMVFAARALPVFCRCGR